MCKAFWDVSAQRADSDQTEDVLNRVHTAWPPAKKKIKTLIKLHFKQEMGAAVEALVLAHLPALLSGARRFCLQKHAEQTQPFCSKHGRKTSKRNAQPAENPPIQSLT